MRCPHCRQSLVCSDRPPLRVWACPACNGCAATLAVLRKAIRYDTLQRVWACTIGHARTSLLPCPSCARAMNSVPTEGPLIDVCRGCQLVWFDARELEAMPHRSAEELAAEQRAARWQDEQREWQRRAEDVARFTAWLSRRGLASF
jgi:Zn-finger nucleic acid-binding protein